MLVEMDNVKAYNGTGYTLLIIAALILTYIIVMTIFVKLPKDKDQE